MRFYTCRIFLAITAPVRILAFLCHACKASSSLCPLGYPNIVATYGRGYTGFAPSYSYQFPGKLLCGAAEKLKTLFMRLVIRNA